MHWRYHSLICLKIVQVEFQIPVILVYTLTLPWDTLGTLMWHCEGVTIQILLLIQRTSPASYRAAWLQMSMACMEETNSSGICTYQRLCPLYSCSFQVLPWTKIHEDFCCQLQKGNPQKPISDISVSKVATPSVEYPGTLATATCAHLLWQRRRGMTWNDIHHSR